LKTRPPGRADTLLSQGNLSGQQREEVLARVLDGVSAAEPAPRGRRALWAGASLAVAAALVLLVVRPALRSDLRDKGGAGPILRVACEPGGMEACRLGSTLLFAVEGAPASAHLAAYAEPLGGGERVWYFSAEGESPPVTDRTPDAVLRRGIRLGAEHRPGPYRLTVLLTGSPLPRAALLDLAGEERGALAVRRWSLTVVP
jgi:hypothetical protein